MGLLKKIMYFLSGSKKQEKPKVKFIDFDTGDIMRTMQISMKPAQHYIMKTGGEYYIYDSIEQMDEKARKTFQELESDAPFTVYIEGEGKTYNSIDEIPEKIRNALRKFEK